MSLWLFYSACVIFLLLCVLLCLRCLFNGCHLCVPKIKKTKNLNGYYIIITGANSGIGFESAKYFVMHGAHVILACRNPQRGKKAETIINQHLDTHAIFDGGIAEYMNVDCSSFKSLADFVNDYKMKRYPLHILINNAGMFYSKVQLTIDKLPVAWQVNYLSGFYLTHELMPLMIHSCTVDGNNMQQITEGRVINVSSEWHKYGSIDWNILNGNISFDGKLYLIRRRMEYGTSKLAQIMHCTFLQRKIFIKYNLPLNAYAVHPGGVYTNLLVDVNAGVLLNILQWLCTPVFRFTLQSAAEGSLQTIYAAIAPNGDFKQQWGGQLIPGAFHFWLLPIATKDRPAMQSVDDEQMNKLWTYSHQIMKFEMRSTEDYKHMANNSYFTADDVNENIDINDKFHSMENTKNNRLLVWTTNGVWLYDILTSQWKKWLDLKSEQQVFDSPCILIGPMPYSECNIQQALYRISGRSVISDRCMKHAEYLPFSFNTNQATVNSWHSLDGNAIERRCSAQSVFLNGEKLLLVGGDDNGDELKTVEEYHFGRHEWIKKSCMNKTRNDFGIACKHKSMQLYVFGGHSVDEKSNISSFLDSIEIYDYALDEWQILDSHLLNGKRARCSAFSDEKNDNQIFIAGGTHPCRNIVEMFDTHKIKAYAMPSLNHCHWWPTMGINSHGRLVCCGVNEQSILNVIETLDIRENKQKWNEQKIDSSVIYIGDQKIKVEKILWF